MKTAAIVLVGLLSQNWPAWRGPGGRGVSAETELPLRWSRTENVHWKFPVGGLGTSSPIIWGNRVFVTLQEGSGPLDGRGAEFENSPRAREANQGEGVRFSVQAFDASTGRTLWRYRLEARGDLPSVHPKHNLASSSAVTDGELVYAWFGTGQLVALDLEGALAWERHLGLDYARFDVLWGHGSSPTLYRDLLLLQCDHPSRAYLVALDKKTGKERWKVERGEGLRSYSTPLVVEKESGDELIVNSSNRIDAFDPATGRPLWHAGDPTTLAIPMPVEDAGVLYASRGYASGPYMALKLGGRGDVSKTHVQWFFPTRAPYVSSLLIYKGVLYMATEMGIVTGMDAMSGENLFRERLEGVFTASPVAGDDKVYLVSEGGDTFVLQAGRSLKVLARNRLEERSLASPAISGKHLFMRTDENLYCIGN